MLTESNDDCQHVEPFVVTANLSAVAATTIQFALRADSVNSHQRVAFASPTKSEVSPARKTPIFLLHQTELSATQTRSKFRTDPSQASFEFWVGVHARTPSRSGLQLRLALLMCRQVLDLADFLVPELSPIEATMP